MTDPDVNEVPAETVDDDALAADAEANEDGDNGEGDADASNAE